MSESVRPSSSKTAMSLAFKRARRKFPKNFGLTPNLAEKENSETEEDLPPCKNDSEPKLSLNPFDPINDKICDKSISDCVESELAESFKEVKLSEEPEIIPNKCQDEPENLVIPDLKLDRSVLDECEKCENPYLQKQEFDYDYENEQPPKPDPSNYTYHETHHNIGLIWNNESDHCDNYGINQTLKNPPISNPQNSLHTTDSEIDETSPPAPPRKFTDETPTRRKRTSHRRKKSSSNNCNHHHSLHEDEQRFEYNSTAISSCPCHEHHCARCQYYYRHCSCCRAHYYCCCGRCCMIWQDRTRETCCPNRRRRSKKKQQQQQHCSTCNGKRRSTSPSIPCSRDSGIFTQTRFEDYEDDYDNDDEETTLMHKDSLSILQEKFAKRAGRRSKDEDEDKVKGRKNCKRVSSRYSYY